jgi:1-acyl-sn-glycerol-3-phosphate acyltransferase
LWSKGEESNTWIRVLMWRRLEDTPYWYRLVRMIGLVLFSVLFGLKREGYRHIPLRGGVLLVSNHQSYLDPIVVTFATGRRVNFMAKEELFHNPIFAYIIRKFGAFPLKRTAFDRGAFVHAVQLLREGKVLAVFGEGTRSKSGHLGALREGPVRIARRAGVPIAPVVISGTGRVLPPGSRFPRGGTISLRVGSLLPTSEPKEGKAVAVFVEELRERMVELGVGE